MVQITAKVCLTNAIPADGADCVANLIDPGDYQGLIGLRVPADLELPDSIPTGDRRGRSESEQQPHERARAHRGRG